MVYYKYNSVTILVGGVIMKKKYIIFLVLIFILSSCAKEIMTPTGNPVELTISPESATLKKKATKKFVTTAYDKNGNAININPTWSVENDIGAINLNGYFFVNENVSGPYPRKGYVIATYNDLTSKVPVTIYLGNYFLYSENNSQDILWDTDIFMDIWEWGTGKTWNLKLSDDTSDPYEGSISLKAELTNTSPPSENWFAIAWRSSEPLKDMRGYENGHINFYMKSDNIANLDIMMQTVTAGVTNDSFKKKVSNYGFTADGKWHHVSIAISDLNNFTDLSGILTYVVFVDNTLSDQVLGNSFYIDQVWWSPD